MEEMKTKIRRTTLFFNRIGWNSGGYRLGTKITTYKAFICSRMEYGIAIMPLNKSQKKLIETTQYEALCNMFSVGKKSSYKTLQLLTGLPSMAMRIDILKSKWFYRYGFIEKDNNMLLPIIEKWAGKAGIVTVMNKIFLEVPLQLQESSLKEQIKILQEI